MSLWAAAIAAAAGIVVFFMWANRQTARAHARFTPEDVETALTEFLDPQARDLDIWYLFLAWPINDPYLESIRLECQRICQEFPPAHAEKRVAALLEELRRRTHGNGTAETPKVSQ